MRNAFADEITKLAAADNRVVLLSGDIGNKLFDRFKAEHPERFLNCGVAEANMISLGAGMALSGLRPVAYTITPFISYRCLEQIRVDVCYHQAPLVIVGVGSGLGYASLGATHHSCEDISCVRALPHIQVVSPADPVETRAALQAALRSSIATYIRIGKKGEPVLHVGNPNFEIGKVITVRPGEKVALLAHGTILSMALDIAERVRSNVGIQPEVVSFHSVKPLDHDYLQRVFAEFSAVVTIEEHSRLGGFGSAIAEWVIDNLPNQAFKLKRFGLNDEFLHEAAETDHARMVLGLSADEIYSYVVNL